MQIGFFDLRHRYDLLSKSGDPLEKLDKIIPWESFRAKLEKTLRRDVSKPLGGRPPYDVILMFKILVLQALYQLSDDQTEFQITDRLSFMRFLSLDLSSKIPDAKTIWCFRELLVKAGIIDDLFAEFDEYLNDEGFSAKGGQIVDASIVEIPKQRNTREENKMIKEGEIPEGWSKNKTCQKDTDARWVKKNNKNFYGYKNHINIDKKHKLIRKYDVSEASLHDSQPFDDLIDDDNSSKDIWADSAYRSEEKEAELREKGYRSKISQKGKRGKALSSAKQKANRMRSKVRARVEHVFGHQTTAMHGTFVRTIGIARAKFKIGMKNLAYNFSRYCYLSRDKYA